jgi:hypothetical protein
MAGDYPSTDFAISEDAAVRRIAHLPSGITIVTPRVEGDPAGVSRVFNVQAGGTSGAHPDEVAQAALRHLRVWLLRRYGIRGRRLRRTVSRARRADTATFRTATSYGAGPVSAAPVRGRASGRSLAGRRGCIARRGRAACSMKPSP